MIISNINLQDITSPGQLPVRYTLQNPQGRQTGVPSCETLNIVGINNIPYTLTVWSYPVRKSSLLKRLKNRDTFAGNEMLMLIFNCNTLVLH